VNPSAGRSTAMTTAPPGWLSRLWLFSGAAGVVVSAVAAVLYAFAVGPWVNTLSDSLKVTAQVIRTLGVILLILASVAFSARGGSERDMALLPM
jgi:hypothetical protein